MSSTLRRSIYRTLAYADVFAQPLTAVEIWRYLITEKKRSLVEIEKELGILVSDLDGKIIFHQGYYCFADQAALVKKRISREKYARRKREIVKDNLGLLSFIPSVCLVGVSGALALGVADDDDDIDLLIIAQPGALWTTRCLATLALDRHGRRRKPYANNFKDKICLNMFLDLACLALPKDERDLYSAHEVVQLEPVFVQEGVYPKFLAANKWVEDFMFNAYQFRLNTAPLAEKPSRSFPGQVCSSVAQPLFRLAEPLVRQAQLRYMCSRVTNEILAKGRIRFHPQDARTWVIPAYRNRLKKYGIDDNLSLS